MAQQQNQLGYNQWAANQADALARWQTGEQGGLQRELQSQRLGQERELTTGLWEQEAQRQTERLRSQEQQAAMGAFGRRWKPNTRWM